MLSEEVSHGGNPEQAVKAVAQIITEAEMYKDWAHEHDDKLYYLP